MSDEPVRAMQNVAAKAPWPVAGIGVPVRVIDPPVLVLKHGVCVLLEQHACEMPPLGSMHEVPDVPGKHEVQAPSVHVPLAPQASSLVCGPSSSGQGRGPTSGGACPVVSGSRMSRVAVF
jgi:hypothetical protein